MSHNYHFSSVVRTLKFQFLSNFEVYNTVLLTIITVLCIGSPELIHLLTTSLYLLNNISQILSPPHSLVTTFPLCFYKYCMISRVESKKAALFSTVGQGFLIPLKKNQNGMAFCYLFIYLLINYLQYIFYLFLSPFLQDPRTNYRTELGNERDTHILMPQVSGSNLAVHQKHLGKFLCSFMFRT